MKFVVPALLSILFSVNLADASIITYGSRADFNAAVSGQTLIDFEAYNPAGDSGSTSYAPLVIDPISFSRTFSNSSGSVSNLSVNVMGKNVLTGRPFLTSSYLDAGISESISLSGINRMALSVDFSTGMHSLGMDLAVIHQIQNHTNITLSVWSGQQLIQNIGLTDLLTTTDYSFLGFTSTQAVTGLTFNINRIGSGPSSNSNTLVIDNFTFSTQSLTAIPEPGSLTAWAMFALVGLGASGRRRRLK